MEGLCLLFFGRFIGRRCVLLWRSRRMRSAGHTLFEVADALAQAARQFGDFAPTEEEQDNRQNYHPMNRTKLAHDSPPRAICGALFTTLPQDTFARQAW